MYLASKCILRGTRPLPGLIKGGSRDLPAASPRYPCVMPLAARGESCCVWSWAWSPESVWRRGAVWAAFRIGAPAGVLFGLLQIPDHRSIGSVVSAGIFFGFLFGGMMAFILRRRWPGAATFDGAERAAIVRAVTRGRAVSDPRLAAGVIDYAQVVQRHAARERRFAWVLYLFAALALSVAIGDILGHSSQATTTNWLVAVIWLVLLVLIPRRRARALKRAAAAEAAARQALSD